MGLAASDCAKLGEGDLVAAHLIVGCLQAFQRRELRADDGAREFGRRTRAHIQHQRLEHRPVERQRQHGSDLEADQRNFGQRRRAQSHQQAIAQHGDVNREQHGDGEREDGMRSGQRAKRAFGEDADIAARDGQKLSDDAEVGRDERAAVHVRRSAAAVRFRNRGSQRAGSSPTSSRMASRLRTEDSVPDEHFQFAIHAREIEPRHHAVVGLFDEEAARRVRQRAHQPELVFGETEAVDVLVGLRARIGQEDLRRGLLDDGRGDAAFQRVRRALRAEAHNAVALADRLFPIP